MHLPGVCARARAPKHTQLNPCLSHTAALLTLKFCFFAFSFIQWRLRQSEPKSPPAQYLPCDSAGVSVTLLTKLSAACTLHFPAPCHCTVRTEAFSRAGQQRPLLLSAGSHPVERERDGALPHPRAKGPWGFFVI